MSNSTTRSTVESDWVDEREPALREQLQYPFARCPVAADHAGGDEIGVGSLAHGGDSHDRRTRQGVRSLHGRTYAEIDMPL